MCTYVRGASCGYGRTRRQSFFFSVDSACVYVCVCVVHEIRSQHTIRYTRRKSFFFIQLHKSSSHSMNASICYDRFFLVWIFVQSDSALVIQYMLEQYVYCLFNIVGWSTIVNPVALQKKVRNYKEIEVCPSVCVRVCVSCVRRDASRKNFYFPHG